MERWRCYIDLIIEALSWTGEDNPSYTLLTLRQFNQPNTFCSVYSCFAHQKQTLQPLAEPHGHFLANFIIDSTHPSGRERLPNHPEFHLLPHFEECSPSVSVSSFVCKLHGTFLNLVLMWVWFSGLHGPFPTSMWVLSCGNFMDLYLPSVNVSLFCWELHGPFPTKC